MPDKEITPKLPDDLVNRTPEEAKAPTPEVTPEPEKKPEPKAEPPMPEKKPEPKKKLKYTAEEFFNNLPVSLTVDADKAGLKAVVENARDAWRNRAHGDTHPHGLGFGGTIRSDDPQISTRWLADLQLKGLQKERNQVAARIYPSGILSFLSQAQQIYAENDQQVDPALMKKAIRNLTKETAIKIADALKDAGYDAIKPVKDSEVIVEEYDIEPAIDPQTGAKRERTHKFFGFDLEDIREEMAATFRQNYEGRADRKKQKKQRPDVPTIGEVLRDFIEEREDKVKWNEERDAFIALIPKDDLTEEVAEIINVLPIHKIDNRWSYMTKGDNIEFFDGDKTLERMEEEDREMEGKPLWKKFLGIKKQAGTNWAGPILSQVAGLVGKAEAKWASELVGRLSSTFAYSFPSMPSMAVGPYKEASTVMKEITVNRNGRNYILRLTGADVAVPSGAKMIEIQEDGELIFKGKLSTGSLSGRYWSESFVMDDTGELQQASPEDESEVMSLFRDELEQLVKGFGDDNLEQFPPEEREHIRDEQEGFKEGDS